MTINIIDPHLHLFARSLGDYHWLKSENPPFWPDKSLIQHDFSIDDLTKCLVLTSNINLSGFVHIEAGFDNAKPWRELEYLESLTFNNLAIEGLPHPNSRTVASINLLASPLDFTKILDKLQQHSSMIGARHILDEQAYSILSNQNVQQNFASLNQVTDFIFELQLPLAGEDSNKVMPLLIQTITNNDQLRFIINHAGFPPKSASTNTDTDEWHLWQKHISELAMYPNVFIKCSGWEMTDRQYQMSWFSAVTSFCIREFSIERVMLASNFPLCLLGRGLGKKLANEVGNKSYADYWQDILGSNLIKQCSENEKSALLYDNALKVYQL
ncbi:MAG: amidohydrolase family protein [Colwellia sp.]|uniref:amidohydrolase family protein n=1 Tax=Colwellia sp. TaxID=56799 RepID=UPI0025BF91B2|nr:amidohydrolase family protein [Colwellia sp.]NQZ26526.1 amidohydrolase family protein [Colwellia sp.]